MLFSERNKARTFSPFSNNWSNKCAPTKPVPPVTRFIKTNIIVSVLHFQIIELKLSLPKLFLDEIANKKKSNSVSPIKINKIYA